MSKSLKTKDENIKIKAILSDKIVFSHNRTWNRFIYRKNPSTVARYNRYRNLRINLRENGYSVAKYSKGYIYLKFALEPTSKPPKKPPIPPEPPIQDYTHLYKYTCRIINHYEVFINREIIEGELGEVIEHLFSHYYPSGIPNRQEADRLHGFHYPNHEVIRRDYLKLIKIRR